ncbi:MAG: effector binding domain-containing protein [Cocleimonas sp.]
MSNNPQQTTLWDEFLPRMAEIKNSISGKAYGVIQQTKDKTDRLEYFAVIEVSDLEILPKGMVSIKISESNYASFKHKVNVKNIDNTVNYIYSSWLLQSGKRHSYGADLEIYGEGYIPDSEESVITMQYLLNNA